MVFNESSLRHILKAYFEYYEHSPTDLALEKDAPEARAIQPREAGIVVELPQVGGCIIAMSEEPPESALMVPDRLHFTTEERRVSVFGHLYYRLKLVETSSLGSVW
jgi:hypothetical protein